MNRVIRVALCLAVALSAAGQAPVDHLAASAEAPVSSPAGWRPWLLSSPDQFRLAAPPSPRSATTRRELRELREMQEDRSRRVRARVRHWNRGPVTVPWARQMLKMIARWRPRPPFAARGLALFHLGLYDALVAAADSRAAYFRPRPAELDRRLDPLLKESGSSYPPAEAVVAGAAETLLTYLFPQQSEGTFERMARRAAETRLLAGVNYRSDVERGLELGRSVAALFIQRGETDGHKGTTPSNPRPTGEQYWEPTPPGEEPPAGGPVGTWTPWLASSPDQFRIESGIAPPPEYGSEAFLEELREVIQVTEDLTPEQADIAVFWDDGPGTFTPPGHWNAIALELVGSFNLGTNQTARMLAYLNAAEADAAISNFESKYHWWSIRPITAARRLCDGGARLCSEEELEADPARATYPSWNPYLVTPPFPAYPGGHSTFSGAGARVLTHFFPGASEILESWADEAAMSRLYGGIHFRSDNDAGLVLGRTIGDAALERASSDGSGD